MNSLVQNLLVLSDLEEEDAELNKLGLSQEEIEGYKEFFLENFLKENDKNDLHVPVSEMSA